MQAWVYLTLAILFEICATSCLKLSFGLTKLVPTIFTLFFYFISFLGLAISLKTIEMGIAYAIWSGVGTALITSIGIFYFHESLTLIKIGSITLIILGVIGLNLAAHLQKNESTKAISSVKSSSQIMEG